MDMGDNGARLPRYQFPSENRNSYNSTEEYSGDNIVNSFFKSNFLQRDRSSDFRYCETTKQGGHRLNEKLASQEPENDAKEAELILSLDVDSILRKYASITNTTHKESVEHNDLPYELRKPPSLCDMMREMYPYRMPKCVSTESDYLHPNNDSCETKSSYPSPSATIMGDMSWNKPAKPSSQAKRGFTSKSHSMDGRCRNISKTKKTLPDKSKNNCSCGNEIEKKILCPVHFPSKRGNTLPPLESCNPSCGSAKSDPPKIESLPDDPYWESASQESKRPKYKPKTVKSKTPKPPPPKPCPPRSAPPKPCPPRSAPPKPCPPRSAPPSPCPPRSAPPNRYPSPCCLPKLCPPITCVLPIPQDQQPKKKKRSTKQSPEVEAKRIWKDNLILKQEGIELRHSLSCLRQKTMLECANILRSTLEYCDKKKSPATGQWTSPDAKPRSSSPRGRSPQTTAGAGCAKSQCGGYTPTGWNKAEVLEAMETPGCCPRPRKSKSPCQRNSQGKECVVCPGQDARTVGVVDCANCPSLRILGEMVFQLERRILVYVFGDEDKSKHRFYGYTVSNICYNMAKENTAPNGKKDAIGKCDKVCRFQHIMTTLQKCGYDIKVHPAFSQDIINRYGVFAGAPDKCTIQEYRLQDACAMSCLINKLSGSPYEVSGLNILLRCLGHLSRCDGKPLFVW